MWSRLFGRKPPGRPPRDAAALVEPFLLPAAHLVPSAAPSTSYFGGDPRLPSGIAWPAREGRPLAFLARVSLARVRVAAPVDWLPGTGALLVFYDVERQPWGYDPADAASWAVLHVPDLEAPVDDGPRARSSRGAVPFRGVDVRPVRSYPSPEREPLASLGLSQAEVEAIFDRQEREFRGLPHHQVGGYPEPVQGDTMELECQLASHGLYCGDARGYRDPRAEALGPGAADWRLLLQVDSDDELGLAWGDGGMLYVWVREQDARAGDFTRAWLVLQCT